jgi:diguanylate cyclase (GGDEF)-like protein
MVYLDYEKLEQENRRLGKNLRDLLFRIENNQKIQAHFHAYEAKIFQSARLPALLDTLLLESLSHFHLDSVSLLLNDRDHSRRTLIEHLGISGYEGHLRFFHHASVLDSLFASPPVVRLGELESPEAFKLFPGEKEIRSCAMLPLLRHQHLMGSIHFGSADSQRFVAGMSVDFLQHLAMIIAVCLENAFGVEFLRQQSLVDVLTQIFNRRSFEHELERELSRSARRGHPLSCLFIDIDHFKKINDAYGHPAGDECLRQMTRQVSKMLRKTDIFARYGGEEFVILLPEETLEHARLTAERIRASIGEMVIKAQDGKTFQATLSIGVAVHDFSCDRETPGDRHGLHTRGEQLIAQADHAMYEAKRAGRNRVCLAQ